MNVSIERPSHFALKLLLLALMGLIVAYPLFQADMVCGADFPGNLAHCLVDRNGQPYSVIKMAAVFIGALVDAR